MDAWIVFVYIVKHGNNTNSEACSCRMEGGAGWTMWPDINCYLQ